MADTETPETPETPEAAAAASAPIAQRLFDARTIIISGEITQKLAARVMAELLALSAASATEPITIYINSQGGHVEAGDTIHDMIRFVTPQVRIVGTGWVASAGALIFVSVPVGQRYCLPNTRFLLHQPAGGAGGTASDIAIEAREIVKMRERLNLIFARETGQPVSRIEDDTHRNFWLGAEEAKGYGLVGTIIAKATELP
ncbi:MAG: ATP-dependent Clp protease proteolytic subunit [Gemmatimonadetes bacterium]|jgi:ATP-dependent Clp protease protease subunit|nr:ATP-dependent Clp protease proteolytic subunit [Gemmatimonadota bacterium]MBK9549738.1 ATP-dependent Clp protease proteolytic subunit [Gemmatimonadota bacterium]